MVNDKNEKFKNHLVKIFSILILSVWAGSADSAGSAGSAGSADSLKFDGFAFSGDSHSVVWADHYHPD